MRTKEAGMAESTLKVWRGAQMRGVFTEVSLAYSFTVSILLTTKRENPLLSFMGGSFSLDINLCLINIFSVFYLPCFSNCRLPVPRGPP